MLSWVLTRSLTRPMSQAVSVFDSIARGKLDNSIEHCGRDEISRLLRALAEMQAKLRQQIESERLQAVVNSRLKVALDSVSTNVMVADAEGRIIYLNPAVQTLLRAAEADIRAHLPGFSCEKLQNANIDEFHRNPSHQKKLLSELRGTHRAEISIGPRTFRLVTNPILGTQGERIGTVVEWADRTQDAR